MDDDALRKYVSLHLWSLREAAYLLCGRAPRNENEFAREDRDTSGDVAQTYRELKDATLAGTLGFAELDGTLMRRRVVALHALEWAVSRGVDLPAPLAALRAAGDQTAPVGSGDGHAERKAAEGRYTLEEAARAIQDGEGERQEAMLHKLMSAAHTGGLPTFEPGRKARMVYGVGPGTASLVRAFYEETFWDDLNKWLQANEARIEYRFPRPSGTQAVVTAPKPIPRARAQEDTIIAALIERGFNPEALPNAPAGGVSEAKLAARKALNYSRNVFDKAWQRLRNDGRIKGG